MTVNIIERAHSQKIRAIHDAERLNSDLDGVFRDVICDSEIEAIADIMESCKFAIATTQTNVISVIAKFVDFGFVIDGAITLDGGYSKVHGIVLSKPADSD